MQNLWAGAQRGAALLFPRLSLPPGEVAPKTYCIIGQRAQHSHVAECATVRLCHRRRRPAAAQDAVHAVCRRPRLTSGTCPSYCTRNSPALHSAASSQWHGPGCTRCCRRPGSASRACCVLSCRRRALHAPCPGAGCRCGSGRRGASGGGAGVSGGRGAGCGSERDRGRGRPNRPRRDAVHTRRRGAGGQLAPAERHTVCHFGALPNVCRGSAAGGCSVGLCRVRREGGWQAVGGA